MPHNAPVTVKKDSDGSKIESICHSHLSLSSSSSIIINNAPKRSRDSKKTVTGAKNDEYAIVIIHRLELFWKLCHYSLLHIR